MELTLPYKIAKDHGKYVVKKKDTGEVVARPKDLAGAKGFMSHAMHAEKKPAKGFPK